MSENNKLNSDHWVPCPPGEISGMVERLQRQRRSVATVKAICGAAVVLFSVAVWQFWASNDRDLERISCREVCSHLTDYQDGSLAKSDPKLLARIERHLEHCDSCVARLRPTKPVASQDLPSTTISLAGSRPALFAHR